MIELTFSDSTAGALKQAIKQGIGFDSSSPDDVYSLNIALDIGDISSLNNISSREKTVQLLYDDFAGVPSEIMASAENAYTATKNAISEKTPIRLWICENDPAELCGLYFICSLIKSDIQLSAVRIPKFIHNHDSITQYYSTGEIPAEKYKYLLQYESAIYMNECNIYSSFWKDLSNENSPLRAIVNGKLMSVPEDFYDFSIKATLPHSEFLLAKIIGKTLVKLPGVSDRWLFLRIRKMIETGELIEISPSADDWPYSAILKKST